MTADASRPTYTVGIDFGTLSGRTVVVRVGDGAMGKVDRAVYVPDDDRAKAYDALYEQHTVLHDFPGRETRVLHRLRDNRNAVVEA